MKKKYLLPLLALLFAEARADEPKNNLVVWAKDGTKVAYVLGERPKITFTPDMLVVESNKTEITYELQKTERITYENIRPTQLSDQQKDETNVRLQEDALAFSNLPTNSLIGIYTTSGKLVWSKKLQDTGEYVLPVSHLETGIYIVNVNGLTYKITKK